MREWIVFFLSGMVITGILGFILVAKVIWFFARILFFIFLVLFIISIVRHWTNRRAGA